MSSPNLNIFIGIGAILVYACVVLFGIDVGVTSSDDVLLFLCKVNSAQNDIILFSNSVLKIVVSLYLSSKYLKITIILIVC